MHTAKPTSKNRSFQILLLGSSAITLYFNSKSEDPFNSMKLILLLLLSGWIFGHLLDSYRNNFKKMKKDEFSILILTSSFIVALLISTMATDVRLIGFLGDLQRKNGFLSYFGLAILFLFTTRVIDFSNVKHLLNMVKVLGFILSLYGLIQISGNDFVAWNNPYNSMISTLGNPNFASALLAVLSTMSLLTLTLKESSNLQKLSVLIIFIMSFIAIAKSNSIQGLLVISIIGLFFVCFYSFLNYRKISYLVIFSSIFLMVVAILGMLQKGPLQNLLYKDSISVRGFYWRAGYEMFLSSPITGVGVDRYGSYFKEFREAAYPLRYGYEITSSNAHNIYIQLFATAGIFVGLTYLLLNLYIFRQGVLLVLSLDSENQKISLILLSAWVGFQAQSIISIDNIGLSIWGWLLGGSILALKQRTSGGLEADLDKNLNKRSNNLVKINIFQPVVSTTLLLPAIIFSSYVYKAETDSFNMRSYSSNVGSGPTAITPEFVNKVLNNPFAEPYLKFKAAIFLFESGNLNSAKSEVLELLKSDPRNQEFLSAMVFFSEQDKDISKSIFYRETIAIHDPWNAKNLLELAKLYKLTGEEEKFRKAADEILDFASNTSFAIEVKEILGRN
jgi:O-antigen ligase